MKELGQLIKGLGGPEDAADDARLRDLGIDSLKTMELVALLEQKCGIEIPDMELTDQNFATIGAIKALIGRLF